PTASTPPSASSPVTRGSSSTCEGRGTPGSEGVPALQRGDLHAVVVVDRAPAHVGVALLDHGVRRGPSGGVLEPASLGGRRDAGPYPVGDLQFGGELADVVVDADGAAVGEAAGGGVGGVDQHLRLPGAAPQLGVVAEAGVEGRVRGGGDQRQRVLLRHAGRVGRTGGHGRHIARDPAVAVGGGAFGDELQPAAGGGETVGERHEPFGDVEPDPPLLAEPVHGDPGQVGVIGGEELLGQLQIRVVQARLGQAHVPGQPAEGLGGGQALAGRRHGGLVPHHVHVPVGDVQVGVLDLHGRGEHDVGVV